MKRFTGTLGFVGAIGWSIFCLYIIFYENNGDLKSEKNHSLILLLITLICILHYFLSTKFWRNEISEENRINEENKIAKLNIEQKELEIKLSELETKQK